MVRSWGNTARQPKERDEEQKERDRELRRAVRARYERLAEQWMKEKGEKAVNSTAYFQLYDQAEREEQAKLTSRKRTRTKSLSSSLSRPS